MGLAIHRADGAPAPGLQEFFARLPESAVRDTTLTDAAFRVLAAVHLIITTERTAPVCLATTADIAHVVGKTERNTFRRLAELERHGHIAREAIRTLPGAPRGIRPLARLRGVRQQSDMTPVSGCTMTPASGPHDTGVIAPCHPCQDAMTPASVPLLLKGKERKDPEDRSSSPHVPSEGATATTTGEGESPEDVAALEQLAAQGGAAGKIATATLRGIEARGKAPGPSAKIPPGPHAGKEPPDGTILPRSNRNSQDVSGRTEHKN